MTGPQRIRTSHRRQEAARSIDVVALLEWTFADEKAGLELPTDFEALVGRGYGMGSGARVASVGGLGAMIDYSGGHTTGCHEDAEYVAATVSNLPGNVGGAAMAVRIAEYARARMRPDCMIGAVPVPRPREARVVGGVMKARTEVWETVRYKHRRRWVSREVRYCPIVWNPTPGQIERAREGYTDWWAAVDAVRWTLAGGAPMKKHRLNNQMPEREPWK